jgi:peptide subunit release factor 1 (eRF1)
MASNRATQTISLYVPEKAQKQKVIERLTKLGKKRDRSVNYLVVEAVLQYLDRESA